MILIAYQKQTFIDDQTVVRAAMLSHMEDGIEAAETAAENARAVASARQSELVSGENIKTINGESLLGSGNLEIGAGAQADWNQNDSTMPDYVKNRTHYTGPGVGVVVEETLLTIADGAAILPELNLNVGTEYTVNWNGTDYSCVAGMSSMDENEVIYLGNFGALAGGTDTGEPFAVVEIIGMECGVICLDGSTAARLAISGHLDSVKHRLDGGYLPEGLPYIEEMNDVLLAETEIQLTNGQAQLNARLNVSVGDSCLVNWNGTDYICPVRELGTAQTYTVIGNARDLGGADTGEPFAVALTRDEDAGTTTTVLLALDASAAAVISVSRIRRLHKLAEEYLPVLPELILMDDAGGWHRITVSQNNVLSAESIAVRQ